jgi:hypothetical protein
LEQLKVPFWKAQPFGYDDEPKEILAWHVKTQRIATLGKCYGYLIESDNC